MKPPPATVVVPPSSKQALRAFGDEITPVLTGADTNGQYSMFWTVTQPGGGPPPHRHMNEDEWFLVVEGRAEFFKDGVWTEVPVGTVVYTPRGVVHSFRNPGTTPLRMLLHTAPSGFENFFARRGGVCEARPSGYAPSDADRRGTRHPLCLNPGLRIYLLIASRTSVSIIHRFTRRASFASIRSTS